MPATFDGPNLRILIPAPGTFSAEVDLYSDWKEWARLSDNAKFPPAFDTTGGDAIGGGSEIAPYFFLRNDLGWRIAAPEATGEVTIDGNLFPRDSARPVFVAPAGSFTVTFRQIVSSRATVEALDEPDAIEAGLTLRQAMRLTVAALAGKLSGAGGSTVQIRNAVADTKNRITATVDAQGNRTAVSTDIT